MNLAAPMKTRFPRAWERLRLVWWEVRRILQPFALVEGVRLPVDRSMPINFRNALYHGNYERLEGRALRATLEPHDVVMELGTGLGFLATCAARVVGSERVSTYEANPALQSIIMRTFRLNRVAPHLTMAILGERDGEAEFFVERLFCESSTTRPSESARRVIVPTLSLNDEVRRVKPTFLVMDIEGAESQLIPFIDLSGVGKLLIEMHPHVIGKTRTGELMSVLADRGFLIVPSLSSGDQFFLARQNKSA